MSGKEDSGLLSANVLQKARSFRDDIKMKIRRSPSHNRDSRSSVSSVVSSDSQKSSPASSSHKSPKHKRRVSRGTSFKEESKSEKRVTKTDIERLETESKKVDHALLGLKVVIDGGWLHMLHGSATVVLEAVMEFKQLVESLVYDPESTALVSACKQVNVSLAALIQWADQVLLHGDTALETHGAANVIKSVNDGVKELHKIAAEKLQNKCTSYSQTMKPKQSVRKQGSYDSSIQQTPLPLTPREKEILQQTSHFNYDTTQLSGHGDTGANNYDTTQLSGHGHTGANNCGYTGANTEMHTGDDKAGSGADVSGAKPPPKPPLPRNREPGFLAESIQKAIEDAKTKQSPDGSTVPALPPKKRTPSIASIYDNHVPDVDSPPQSPKSHIITQNTQNPPFSNNNTGDHAKFYIVTQSTDRSPGSLNIAQDGANLKRDSPKRVIPIHVKTEEESMKSSEKRQSPDRISSVSSISSRSSSFSLTKSASSTSQTIVLPAGSGSTGSDVSVAVLTGQGLGVEKDPSGLMASVPGSVVTSSRKEHVTHVSASRAFTQSRVSAMSSSAVQNTQVSSMQQINTPGDSRLSQYDNFDKIIREHHNEQFQSIADQIKQLTFGVENVDLQNDPGAPPLPQKANPQSVNSADTLMQRTRQRIATRPPLVSQYDNFSDAQTSDVTNVTVTKQARQEAAAEVTLISDSVQQQPVILRGSRSAYAFSQQKSSVGNGYAHQQQTVMKSSQTFSAVSTTDGADIHRDLLINPPPLPPKRKNVESYMQIFGATSPSFSHMARQSIHAVAHYQSQWMQHQLELHPMLSITREWAEDQSKLSVMPPLTIDQPALLPNRSNALSMLSDVSSGRGSDVFSIQSGSSEDYAPPLTPPFPPKIPDKKSQSNRQVHQGSNSVYEELDKSAQLQKSSGMQNTPPVITLGESDDQDNQAHAQKTSLSNLEKKMDSGFAELTVLDDTNVSDQLIKNEPGSDEPEIRGGAVDALIVHAATAGVKEILYQEAFLTTYRTFITPQELIEKLLYRYNRFSQLEHVKKRKLASAAFSLLIRVVDEMCTEINEGILKILTDTVYQFLSQGSLMLAKILRRKIVEKVEQKKRMAENSSAHLTLWEKHHMTTKQYSLLDFHARHIAEQMTLLDAELFQKIEIPEVLLWPQFQNEEQSPNLTQFTVHFNKVSYWCRTLILSQEDAKEREKIHLKFIKIMKHLRRHNNFNSYLAILSAIDSAPIRRLDWPRQSYEAVKDFCQLIDSSSSFRAYRTSLAEAEAPCIPYIGIILQDLTFVHIGNPEKLDDGNVNFSKRWQQFHILDNMKRFRKCNYEFKKEHRILAFFDDFELGLSEESLWQISEDIKPRGGKKKNK